MPLLAQEDPPAADSAAPAKREGLSRFTPARRVVRSADADGDGQVGAKEWRAYLDGLAADEAGALDPVQVEARVVARMLDVNGDRYIGLEHLFQIFETFDKNIDFHLDRAELQKLVNSKANSVEFRPSKP